MAIYLVDYENVYIEGLTGIEQLTEEDTLHIFYTQNRCGLTFGLYRQLIACKAKVELDEVSVSIKNGDPVKNALDIQLMMFAGFLIGSKSTDALYIVSKDKDFLLGTDFYRNYIPEGETGFRVVPSIAASMEEPVQEAETASAGTAAYDAFLTNLQAQITEESPTESFAMLCDRYAVPTEQEELSIPMALPEETFAVPMQTAPLPEAAPLFTVQYCNTVRNLLGKNADEETVSRVCEIIYASDDLVAFNNALARYYRDGQRTKQVYHKFKPKFENLRHLSRVVRKG
ncbi:MAG: hypothetical protein E7504_04415 [Ruminococcus sp.]|nr:hypothetical protein [Ruminococcus sp.]